MSVSGGGSDVDAVPSWPDVDDTLGPTRNVFGVVAGLTEPLAVVEAGASPFAVGLDVIAVLDRGLAPGVRHRPSSRLTRSWRSSPVKSRRRESMATKVLSPGVGVEAADQHASFGGGDEVAGDGRRKRAMAAEVGQLGEVIHNPAQGSHRFVRASAAATGRPSNMRSILDSATDTPRHPLPVPVDSHSTSIAPERRAVNSSRETPSPALSWRRQGCSTQLGGPPRP